MTHDRYCIHCNFNQLLVCWVLYLSWRVICTHMDWMVLCVLPLVWLMVNGPFRSPCILTVFIISRQLNTIDLHCFVTLNITRHINGVPTTHYSLTKGRDMARRSISTQCPEPTKGWTMRWQIVSTTSLLSQLWNVCSFHWVVVCMYSNSNDMTIIGWW